MNNTIIRTAIIDDGINEKFYSTGELEHNIEISPELEVRDRAFYDSYSPSHGTTCAAIIKKYSPFARLTSIKILNDRARGMSEQLVKALEWCVENKIKLVNLSLGTIVFKDFPSIKKAVNYAYRKGVIIVAACNNKSIYTYPASHSCVIGVKRDLDSKLGEGEIMFNTYPYDGIEVTAFSSHSLTDYKGNIRRKSPSNSFAAPLVTAIVNNILLDSPNKTLEEIKIDLSKMSASPEAISYNPHICRNMDWVNKAVLFCLCQKEHCTCNNIPFYFDVDEIVHIRPSLTNNSLDCIKEYLENSNSNNLAPCDTIAILDDNLSPIYGKDDLRSLIKLICGQNKNIILLGKNSKEPIDLKECKTKLWTPSAPHSFTYKPDKSKKIEIPIVMLCDPTGSSLLKLQDSLIEMFRKDGYNALPATSSSFGSAAGFEYLPFDSEKPKNFLNALNELGRLYNPDIIIYSTNSSNLEKQSEIRGLILSEIDVEITLINQPENKKSIQVSPTCINDDKNIYTPATFHLNDEKSIVCIYKHIIELFSQDT